MEVVVTTGAISRAKVQSYHHHQQTNTQFFTGRMPFQSPNQHCQSTEEKKFPSLRCTINTCTVLRSVFKVTLGYLVVLGGITPHSGPRVYQLTEAIDELHMLLGWL